MKKLIIGTISFVVVCVIISVFIIPAIPTSTDIKAESIPKKYSTTYLVKNFENKIAVFEENATEPFRVTNVMIDSLPEADRELLNKGIKANNQKELSSILEDYCS